MFPCYNEIRSTNLKGHRNMDTSMQYKIGEVYLMKFEGTGSEQQGWRPGVIFQNNTGNQFSPNVIALPMTSSLKKVEQPTHVIIPSSIGLNKDSMVLCENPERMSKKNIGTFLTTVPRKYMEKIAIASLLATSALSFISPEILLSVWQQAYLLNDRVA